ncbi:MAG: hypothetical protein O7D91_11455 [Planctomycetota bacterium]|nr:hypothetical protein [Planctomycetota bacterium]
MYMWIPTRHVPTQSALSIEYSSNDVNHVITTYGEIKQSTVFNTASQWGPRFIDKVPLCNSVSGGATGFVEGACCIEYALGRDAQTKDNAALNSITQSKPRLGNWIPSGNVVSGNASGLVEVACHIDV